MDSNEIKKKLEAAGIPVGGWGESTGGARNLPGILARQKHVLEGVRELLRQQIEADKTRVSELQEQLERTKHGGGR